MDNKNGLMNLLDSGGTSFMSDLARTDEESEVGAKVSNNVQQEMVPAITPQSQQMWNFGSQHGLSAGARYPASYGGMPNKQVNDGSNVPMGTQMMSHYSQFGNVGNMGQSVGSAGQSMTGSAAYGYQGMSPRMPGQGMSMVQGGNSAMWSNISPGSDKSSSPFTNLANASADAGVRAMGPANMGKYVTPVTQYLIQQSPSQRVAPFHDIQQSSLAKNYQAQQQQQQQQLGSPPPNVSQLVPVSPHAGSRMLGAVQIPYSQGSFNISSFQNAESVQQGQNIVQQLNNGQYQFMACSPGGASNPSVQQGMMGNIQVYGQQVVGNNNYRMGYSNTVQVLSPGSSGHVGKQNLPLATQGGIRTNPSSQGGSAANATAAQPSGSFWHGMSQRQLVYQNGAVDPNMSSQLQLQGMSGSAGFGSGGMIPGQSVIISAAGGQYTAVTPLYQGTMTQHSVNSASADMGQQQQQQVQHHGYGMQQAQSASAVQQSQHQIQQQQHHVQLQQLQMQPQHAQQQQHLLQQHQLQQQQQHHQQIQHHQQMQQQHQAPQHQVQQQHQIQQQQMLQQNQLQQQQQQLHMQQLQMHQLQHQSQLHQHQQLQQQQQGQQLLSSPQGQQHQILQAQHQIQQQHMNQQTIQHQLQHQVQQQHQIQQGQQQQQQQQVYFSQKPIAGDGAQLNQSLVILQPSMQPQQQHQVQPVSIQPGNTVQSSNLLQMGEASKMLLPQSATVYVYNGVNSNPDQNSQMCFGNLPFQMNQPVKEDAVAAAPILHLPELKPALVSASSTSSLSKIVAESESLSTPPPPILTDTEDGIHYAHSYTEKLKTEVGFIQQNTSLYDFPGDPNDELTPKEGKKKRKRKSVALNEDGTPVKRKRKKEVKEEVEDKPSSSFEPSSTLELGLMLEPSSTLEPSSSFQPEVCAEMPEKKHKKSKKKSKAPKDPDAPKAPKRPRTPKEGKGDEANSSKKTKSSRARKRKTASLIDEVNEVTSTVEMSEVLEDSVVQVEQNEGETPVKEKAKPPPRPKSKKKRPLPTFLKSKKSKISRSDNSDIERTPPASPVGDDNSQKRRSSRFTKRHKYLDDLDLNLSDEENQLAAVEVDSTVVVKPVQFFVDNPLEEDAQIVEKILGVRIGKRSLNPPAVEVPEPPAVESEVLKEEGETEIKIDADHSSEQKNDDDLDLASQDTQTQECEESNSLNEKLPCSETSDQTQVESPQKTETLPESKEVSQASESSEAVEQVEVEEFYVKYKNFSYLHCEWRTADELELCDKRVAQKIKRHKIKMQQNPFYQSPVDDEDLFNPDYVEVDRILDMSTSKDPRSGEELTHYLVKWRALAYEDSTWELAQDVEESKVKVFLQIRDPPREPEREYKARPSADEWESLEKCPLFKNDNTLREYQLEGLNWLSFCYFNKQNCILADEMGLGKTIQSISFVEHVFRYGIRGPFLIIVPLSTIGNWQREFEAWTDLNVIVYHGSTQSRNMIQEYEMYYKDAKGKRIPNICRFHGLITTYEVIISDLELLRQVDWRVAIIDEAHRLKNRNCRLLQVLNCFDVEHRVLLTGTPLQNNVEELFSLLSFLEPKQFASPEAFLAEFGKLESEAQVEKLKALLKPMMLRRLKEDVEKSLAPKEETIIEVELTNIQKKYYRAILERNFSFLAKGGTSANVPNLMNTMMELRKCCNHPYLINGAEEQILEEFHVGKHGGMEKMFQTMVHSSGKLVLTDKLLPKLKADGHKVLVFSQMIRVLDIIEDYLVYKKYPFERIDGRIRGNLRQEAIDRFSKPDSDRFVFLLCTRAGGLGINLTAADTVIIYDSDWNPQNDLQAQARCHRIGQLKSVKVYRLITRNTYEREMFDRASLKLGLDKAVLQSMGPKDITSGQLSKKEIEDLLKKGAYGALMEDDSTGTDFCEEDIEHILQRRTQVVQIEAGVKGSTFAKASFSLSTNRNDIDIDDPQFWQKWAKKADLNAEELLQSKENLIIEMPRQRRQVHRYGKQDATVNLSDLDTSGTEDEDDDGAGGGGGGGGGGAEGKGTGSKNRRKRRGRHNNDDADTPCSFASSSLYTRSDCFNVERGLLVYGWGRWSDILRFEPFKRKLEVEDIKTISRAMLFYCLQTYDGDERIKMFIYDLVSPEDGQERSYKNHSGLSAPVPRGRKGRKSGKKLEPAPKKSPAVGDLTKIDIDPERILMDSNYKKHLKRHANKILLRVRLLYYLKQEIVGDQADKVLNGSAASDVVMPIPPMDGEFPVFWWNREADKCLLLGVFKHGYEKYGLIRQDPGLCFLSRCGPPDGAALLMEQDTEEDIREENDDDDQDLHSKQKKDTTDDFDDLPASDPDRVETPLDISTPEENGTLPFPSVSDLNARLRRLITAFQRSHKRELLRQEQIEKRLQRREQCDIILKEKEQARMAAQQNRWSRREEADFYRVVSTFGVERDPKSGELQWENFRNIAHLDRKYDDTLSEYFRAFYHMCLSVCRRIPNDGSVPAPASVVVEPITEERANRCLGRIDLLCKIREQILTHLRLEERLVLCQPTPEMPEWWKCGVHDKELLIGAARHGLSKTEFHILGDPLLSFTQHIPKSEQENRGNSDDVNQDSEKPSVKTPASLSADFKAENSGEENVIDLKSKAGTDDPAKVKILCQADDVKLDATDEFKQDTKPVSLHKDSNVNIVDAADNADAGVKHCSDLGLDEDREMDRNVVTSDDNKVSGADDSVDGKPLDLNSSGKTIDQSEVVEPANDSLEDGVLNLATIKRAVDSDETSSKPVVSATASDSGVSDSKDVKAGVEIEETVRRQNKTTFRSEETERSHSPCADSLHGEDASSQVDNTMEGTGFLFANSQNHWPKDRVIYHRLENICLCVEKGEWPVNRRYFMPGHVIQGDSHSNTPVPGTPATGSSTPVLGVDYSAPISSDHLMEGITQGFQKKRHRRTKAEMEADRVARLRGLLVASRVSAADRDLENLGLHGAALIQKMMDDRAAAGTATSRGGDEDSATSSNEVIREPLDWVHAFKKRRRGRRSKVDQLLERQALEAFEQRTMLGNAWHPPGTDFRQQISVPTTTPEKQLRAKEEKPVANQMSKANDEPEVVANLVLEKKKPARESGGNRSSGSSSFKAESLAGTPKKLPPQISEDEETVSLSLGSSSSEQLKERMLQNFLGHARRGSEDQGALEDKIQSELSQVIGLRQRRRPRLDPSKMEVAEVTGDENISVIDRGNGKRITGAKAPPLRYLKDWLLSNPTYDVDPKWAHIVKAKGNLPAELYSRILRPSGRGRHSTTTYSSTPHSAPSQMDFLSNMTNLQAMASGAGTAGLMGFPNLPYPGLSLGSLGLANPMLAAASYASLGLLPGLGKLDLDRGEGGSGSNEKDDKEKGNAAEKSSSGMDEMDLGLGLLSGIHPSFPFSVYAPMLMNPFFAQNLAAATTGFSLPAALPGSFPGLGALPLSGIRTAEGGAEEGRAEAKSTSRRHKAFAPATITLAQAEPEDLSTQTTAKAARNSSRRSDGAPPSQPNEMRTAGDVEELVQDLSVERKSTSVRSDVAKSSAPARLVSASQGTSSTPVAAAAVFAATGAAPVRSQQRRGKTGLLDSISSKLMAQKMSCENRKNEQTDAVSADDDRPLTAATAAATTTSS